MRVLEWRKRSLLVAAVLTSTVVCVLVTHNTVPTSGPSLEETQARESSAKEESGGQDGLDFLPSLLQIPRLAEYCNTPESVVLGEEGEAPKDYVLRSVYVIVVHGASTPRTSVLDLEPSSSPYNCTMDAERLRHFPQLRHFLSDMAEQGGRQQSGGEFSYWALHPQHKHCGLSQLTGQGALQHLLTGLALRDSYVHKHNLFGSEEEEEFSSPPVEQLRIHSTRVSRSFQSAVSLLYAFLPRFNLTQLDFRPARDALFCDPSLVPADCCRSVYRLQQRMERERSKRKMRNDVDASSLLAALADVLETRVARLPPLDVLAEVLEGYVCRGLPLPCGRGGGGGGGGSEGEKKCVTAAMFGELLRLVDGEADVTSRDVAADRYSRLLTHPLLLDILTSMDRVASGRSKVRFTLYSGHDLTLTSVLQALGVQEGKQLRRAARVVLELYSKGREGRGSHHVRVLRDGRDVTSLVRFCRGRTVSGLCRLKELETFVARDNAALMAATDRQGTGAFCHVRH
ncbi:2-phosphoxylose phosphatase 1-like [Babylonia areolata]|uniref:2-phosphoxylose phosphatase 1-like n=1 Tax=Babylonia areolata TaxID=304850 RepID=UPI003FD1CE2C